MQFIKEERNRRIADAICLIVLGVLICAFYSAAVEVFCLVSGIVALVFGCLYVAAYFGTFLIHDAELLLRGLFFILIGVSILSDPGLYLYIMVFGITFFLLYVGIEEIAYAVNLKRLGVKNWWADLIAAIVYLACGIAILVVEFTGGNSLRAVTMLCGGSLILEGVFELILIYALHRDYKKANKNVVSEQ